MLNTDWKNLPFGYMKTDYNIRCLYKDGKWQKMEVSSSEYINIHIASTCLHYGQEAFEGMKAFRGKDGKIRLFRWRDNAKRMRDTALGIKLAIVPEELLEQIEEKDKNKKGTKKNTRSPTTQKGKGRKPPVPKSEPKQILSLRGRQGRRFWKV